MKRFLAAICMILLLGTGAFAQTGTISGTVSDVSGAVIPGVEVTVLHVGTNLARTVITNESGGYVVPVLPTGEYNVTAVLPGFQTIVRTGIQLRDGNRTTVNLQLEVGSLTETVTVTEAAPLIQSETSSIGTIIENQRVSELPLASRKFQDLTMLVPGVRPSAQGSHKGFRGGISVAGARDGQTRFSLDGVDMVTTVVQVTTFYPSVDMIQEFRVETSTYSAEFGRNAGGQIRVTTKSGSNELHGTMFEFVRNDALEAKNFFHPAGVAKPKFRRNNFGASVGGPIVKDKTFFFGNYDGLLLRQGQTRASTVPSPTKIGGDFSGQSKLVIDPVTGQPFPGNIIPRDRISPIGDIIARQYPAPNLPGTVRNFVASPILTRDTHQFTGKVDHRISDANNLIVRYTFNDSQGVDPYNWSSSTNLPDYGRTDKERTMNVGITNTHIFSPAMVGELRLGYNRYTQIRANLILEDIPEQWGIKGTTKSPNPIDHGVPSIRVSGFESIGKFNIPSDRTDIIYQLAGSLNYTSGNHSLKMGADMWMVGSMRLNNGGGRGEFRFTGAYTGTGLADLLLGYPRQTKRRLGDSRNPMWHEFYSLYLQDDWKVTPRLTLNLGLRYDVGTPNRSAHDRLARFNPDTGNIEIVGKASMRRDIDRIDNPLSVHYRPELATLAATIPMVDLGNRSLYTMDKNDIAPRIGLAYRATDRLAVRMGWGVFFDQAIGSKGGNHGGWKSFPFFIQQDFNGGLNFDNAISMDDPFPARLARSAVSPSSSTPHYRTPYVQHYNLGIQYEPWNEVLVDLAFVGSASRKLYEARNINQPVTMSSTASVGSRRPYQGFGNISWGDSVAPAQFNSLQARVEARNVDGFTLAGAYTFAKNMDRFSDSDGDGRSPNDYDLQGNMWGPASNDIRHRVVVSYVYEFPTTSRSGVAGLFANGWEISGINSLQTGPPFTVSLAKDVSNNGIRHDRPNLIGDPFLSGSERTADRWFNTAAFGIPERGNYGDLGRNTMRGPGFRKIDFAFIKKNYFGEDKQIQFRAELFNAFNRTNLHTPNRIVDSSSAGFIFTASEGRQLQFGLKILF
jgi:hypothetical protein